MMLTDKELESIYNDHRDQMVSIQLGRSVEAAVLAKLTSGQDPVATVIKSGASRQWISERLGKFPDGTYSLYADPAQQQPLCDT